jgi:hypothetical protein
MLEVMSLTDILDFGVHATLQRSAIEYMTTYPWLLPCRVSISLRRVYMSTLADIGIALTRWKWEHQKHTASYQQILLLVSQLSRSSCQKTDMSSTRSGQSPWALEWEAGRAELRPFYFTAVQWGLSLLEGIHFHFVMFLMTICYSSKAD